MGMRSRVTLLWAMAGMCGAVLGCSALERAPKPSKTQESAPVSVFVPDEPANAEYETLCGAGVDSGEMEKRGQMEGYGFKFDLTPLYPVANGPLIQQMPRRGPRRHLGDIRQALDRQTKYMSACYRWVRYARPDEGVVVQAAFNIDPFGALSDITTSTETDTFGELAECVKAGLEAARVSHRTPRMTKARIRLKFVPSKQGRPDKAPVKPTPPPHMRVASCIQHPVPMPVDLLDDGDRKPLATFDDWSREQDREEWRVARAAGRPAPLVHSWGCTPRVFRSHWQELERTIRANFGAYGRCYAEALGAEPGLSGELEVFSLVQNTGLFRPISVEGVGSERLHACMRSAFEELQVQPATTGSIVVRYTFVLTPQAEAEASGADDLMLARTQLKQRETQSALESFVKVASRDREPARQCWARLGIVQAMLAKAPWVDDPRVRLTTQDFLKHASTWPRSSEVRRCLEEAAPAVAEVGAWPFSLMERPVLAGLEVGRWGAGPSSRALQLRAIKRSESLLGAGKASPERRLLLEFVASAYTERGALEPARDALATLFSQGLEREQVEALLNEYTYALELQLRREESESQRGGPVVLRDDGCIPPVH